MADQYYKVVVGADTKSAQDKIDAVQNSLDNLTSSDNTIKVNVDASAIRRTVSDTELIANNIRRTSIEASAASKVNIISDKSVNSAIALAANLSAANKDFRGLQTDLVKALKSSNLSEIMKTDKVLDKLQTLGSAQTRKIATAYEDIRSIPGVDQLIEPVEMYGRAFAWEKYGSEIADATLNGVRNTIEQRSAEVVAGAKNFFYGDIANDIVNSTASAIDTLARLGLAIQGVQLLVGPLAQAWGAAFDSIIGQNIRLQQTLLSTQTTLASTGRLIDNTSGQEISDPLTKINLLSDGVTRAIENIRVRSLDLAGVTSQQIIDVFGLVATSINQIGGDIKDAEDLAISFTAALGTLGIPLYQANQEISSILSGSISEDSILAKRLQISNADINKARSSVDGVVGYLQKKLETAVAGQAISAKTFTGITSNIQEVFENIGQKVGAPLLAPLLTGLEGVYTFLKNIKGFVVQLGEFVSKLLVSIIRGLTDIFSRSKVFQGLFIAIDKFTKPFRALERSIELGLNNAGINLIDQWVNGLAEVPTALQSIVNGLVSVGNFLKLQISLITDPILKLLDQSRAPATGAFGFAQGVARAPQALLGEGLDAFTKGWDTISSTIETAVKAAAKFGTAIAKLKITELTAGIRAAATVFELFGNVLLGKINLALTFFDVLGSLADTELAKFIVSMTAINKLIQQSDFFGLKPILLFLTSGKGIFKQLVADIGLFAKGFKDAGNIDKYVKNMVQAQQNFTKAFSQSNNPIQANTAKIKLLREELDRLRIAQKQVVNDVTNVPLTQELNRQRVLAQNASLIKETTAELRNATKVQREFTLAQRAGSAIKGITGSGAEIAAATQASREAALVASGAAARQALSSAFTTIGTKLGLSGKQLEGLTGAFNIATRSVKQFITVSLGINLAFAGIGLVISGVITLMQQLEEAEQRRRTQAKATADVNRILASSYEGIVKAAEGGDIAAQQRLENDRDAANAAYQLQIEKKAKLLEEEQKINEAIAKARRELKSPATTVNPVMPLMAPGDMYGALDPNAVRSGQQNQLKNAEKERLAILEKQAVVNKEIYRIREAQAKIQETEKLQEDFKLIGQRRLDLEQRIKTAREDYTKEVTDKEFQSRMEILSLEQQKRREIQQQELDALRERFNLLANNATEQDRQIIDLVRNYEVALLEATNNEGNRRAELAMKEAQLRKEIEDYAFKMAREKVNLEKQVGAYIKEVENWKGRKQKERLREELSHARQMEDIASDTYLPYDLRSQQQFVNAALKSDLYKGNGKGYYYTVDEILALLQFYDKKTLDITSSTDPATIIKKLEDRLNVMYPGRQPKNRQEFMSVAFREDLSMDTRRQYFQSLVDEASSRTNSKRFYEPPQDPNNLKEPDLNIDWSGLQSRVESLSDSFLNAQKALDAAVSAGDAQKIRNALNAFRDPSNYTNLKSDYRSEKLSSLLDTRRTVKQLNLGSINRIDIRDDLDNIRTQAASALRTGLLTLSKGAIDLSGDFIYDAVHETRQRLAQVTDNSERLRLTSDLLKKLNIFDKKLQAAAANMLNAIFSGTEKAMKNARDTFLDRVTIAQSAQIRGITEQAKELQKSVPTENYDNLYSRFQEAQSTTGTNTYSISRETQKIEDFMAKFTRDSMIKLTDSEFPMDPELAKMLNNIFLELKSTLLLQVEAQHKANVAVENFATRAQAAADMTNAVVDAQKQYLTSLLTNSTSLKEATQSMMQSISNQVVSMFADFALRPMREQLMNTFKKIFGVNKAEEQAKQAVQNAQDALLLSNAELRNSLDNLRTSIDRAASPLAPSETPAPGGAPAPAPGTQSPPQTPAQQALEKATAGAADRLNQQARQTDDTAKKGFDYGRALQGATQALAGIAMAVSGVQQMKQGGTYNTLMGLASIFGSIGSITGMFAKGGAFGPRALGGPVTSRQPYLVGESGPELFVPQTNGRVISHDRTRGMFDMTRQALAARNSSPESGNRPTPSASLQPIQVRYESQVINNVEYVTTEQYRKGMKEAAQRGQQLAYQGMQHSVKVRRRLGLA